MVSRQSRNDALHLSSIIVVIYYSLLASSSSSCYTVQAFVQTQQTSSSALRFRSYPGVAVVSLARLKASASNSISPPTLARLTPQEQTELLGRAVQARRIKETQTKLALQPVNRKVSKLQIGASMGYESLSELEEVLYQGQLARETLVTRNMGLVYYAVNEILGKHKSKCQSVSREDLVQEGAIGLARAVDRWNPDIGGKFSTYAMYWIRAAMLRCIAERDDIVRVPEHVSEAVRKMTRAAQQLGLDIDGENLLSQVYNPSSSAKWKEAQSAKALAEAAGLTDKQLMEAMKVRRRRNGGIISFESWMQQGKDYMTDLTPIQDQEGLSLLSSFEKTQLKKALSRYLRPREIEALSWRYGLNHASAAATSSSLPSPRNYVAEAEEHLFGASSSQGLSSEIPVQGKWGEYMSFVEVGKRMQVSAEYCRRLCHAALDKLRQAADEGTLEPSLFSV